MEPQMVGEITSIIITVTIIINFTVILIVVIVSMVLLHYGAPDGWRHHL